MTLQSTAFSLLPIVVFSFVLILPVLSVCHTTCYFYATSGLHLVAPFFVTVVVFKLRISWGYVSRLMIGHVGHETISNDNALLCLACLLCLPALLRR